MEFVNADKLDGKSGVAPPLFVTTRSESVRKKTRIRPTYADANRGHPSGLENSLLFEGEWVAVFRVMPNPTTKWL